MSLVSGARGESGWSNRLFLLALKVQSNMGEGVRLGKTMWPEGNAPHPDPEVPCPGARR